MSASGARGRGVALLLFASAVVLTQAGRRWGLPSGSPIFPSLDADGLLLIHGSTASKWKNRFSSEQVTGQCELLIENNLHEPILMCWVSPTGRLVGFRKINDQSIRDKSVPNHHTEYSYGGHAFLCIKCVANPPTHLSEVPDELFICHYMLTALDGETMQHHLVIDRRARVPILRPSPTICVQRSVCAIADAVVDSSQKIYESITLGGFTVQCEAGVFASTPSLEATLTLDIATMCRLLPDRARRLLQESTPIWLNKSLVYGPQRKPINEQKAMFHPLGGETWLRKNGLSELKAGSVEICNADDYLRSRQYWGPGGILVHEFCHAYHNKFCPEGFDCPDILDAFESAMHKQLYECVRVHGPQGANGPIKHYACSNHMEFFAELSVAYHWKESTDEEYNKWFPFNRHQLLCHDPDTYHVLHRHWEL